MYHIGIFIEVLTVIIAFVNFKKFKGTIYKYFIFFLVYVAINEIVGVYLFVLTLKIPNDFIYNSYNLIKILFFLYFYGNFIRNKKTKKLINSFYILYLVSFFAEIIIGKHNVLTSYLAIFPIFGAVLLLIVLIFFLFEIINNEKIIFNLYKSMIFWISVGLLLFGVGTIPIFISREIMNYNITYQYILFGLNVIMYGCFIIGFILSEKEYNYLDNGKS